VNSINSGLNPARRASDLSASQYFSTDHQRNHSHFRFARCLPFNSMTKTMERVPSLPRVDISEFRSLSIRTTGVFSQNAASAPVPSWDGTKEGLGGMGYNAATMFSSESERREALRGRRRSQTSTVAVFFVIPYHLSEQSVVMGPFISGWVCFIPPVLRTILSLDWSIFRTLQRYCLILMRRVSRRGRSVRNTRGDF
jgi:hypothetical protein